MSRERVLIIQTFAGWYQRSVRGLRLKPDATVVRLALLGHPLVLSPSKDEPCCSWFDELTTSGNVLTLPTLYTTYVGEVCVREASVPVVRRREREVSSGRGPDRAHARLI